MKYKLLTLSLAVILSFRAGAQKLTVINFEKTNDIIAANDRRLDYNGKGCALIKVQLVDDITDVEWQVIGDIVKHGGAEKWVYMEQGSKKMKIIPQNHLPIELEFKNYGIEALEGNRVYVLILNEEIQVQTSTEGNHLKLNISPIQALVTITGKNIARQQHLLNKRGQINIFLPYGNYNYEVTAEGYYPESRTIFIGNQELVEQIELQPEALPNPSPSADSYKNFIVSGVPFSMVSIEGGTFTMGATSEHGSDTNSNDSIKNSVTLSTFCIGETEVTQELWNAVMDSNPSYYKGAMLPVEQISWNDCLTFITKLNSLTGMNFRLPTEAEWEYAARGGIKSKGYRYSGSDTINDVAWYDGNSNSKTHPVGLKQPNELGLYDMSGNVWEWCQDTFNSYESPAQTDSTSFNLLRGGSWNIKARYCHVTYQGYRSSDKHYNNVGLRLAL